MPEFDQSRWLWLLPLALLPWLWPGQRRVAWASLAMLPPDAASRAVAAGLKTLASLGLAACLLSLAGVHREGAPIERTGRGAHVMLVLDRSTSMADGFAGQSLQQGEESKGRAAARLLDAFVAARAQDLFGLVTFSTAPIHVLGLTGDRIAVRAAASAAASPGEGLTNVAAGLTMALDEFRDRPRTGSRVVLLVSDGAASIDVRAQTTIRRLFQQMQAQLYWIYLRAPQGGSPTRLSTPDAGADLAPEYYLDQYFRDLGVPYSLYEADNAQSLEQAIGDVARLQNLPLRYLEPQPRHDLAPWCDAVALAAALVWTLARMLEVPAWR